MWNSARTRSKNVSLAVFLRITIIMFIRHHANMEISIPWKIYINANVNPGGKFWTHRIRT